MSIIIDQEHARGSNRKTLLVSLSVALVSIANVIVYHRTMPEVDASKITQQAVRFVLTVVLLVAAYKGKAWASTAIVLLFAIGLLAGVAALLALNASLLARIPLLVMVLVFAVAVHHYGWSDDYKRFVEERYG